MSLAEEMKEVTFKVLELEGRYRLLHASVQGVIDAMVICSENNGALKVTADHLKEILEKDKLD